MNDERYDRLVKVARDATAPTDESVRRTRERVLHDLVEHRDAKLMLEHLPDYDRAAVARVRRRVEEARAARAVRPWHIALPIATAAAAALVVYVATERPPAPELAPPIAKHDVPPAKQILVPPPPAPPAPPPPVVLADVRGHGLFSQGDRAKKTAALLKPALEQCGVGGAGEVSVTVDVKPDGDYSIRLADRRRRSTQALDAMADCVKKKRRRLEGPAVKALTAAPGQGDPIALIRFTTRAESR